MPDEIEELKSQEEIYGMEIEKLKSEKARRDAIKQEKKHLKESKKTLKSLKNELHPSKFKQFSKAIATVGKGLERGSIGSYKIGKQIYSEIEREKRHHKGRSARFKKLSGKTRFTPSEKRLIKQLYIESLLDKKRRKRRR